MDAGKVILLVEDNEDDEILTLRALQKNNFANEVIVARTGEEAIGLLLGVGDEAGRATGALPAVVLLDLNLPKMTGLDVLRELRSHNRTRLLPVVVLTSSREDEDIVNSYSLRANAYVRKPVDFAQFTETVRTLGLFWLLLNEVPKPQS